MILAVDIGTSTFKAALFTAAGECKKIVTLPLAITLSDGVRHEAESAQWLRAFEESVVQLGGVSLVEALVIGGNGPSLVPVIGAPGLAAQPGAALELPAAAARLWLDRRAQKESVTASAIMGAYVDPGFFLPKCLWIKNNEAALYEKTKCFLSCPEYLIYALTGEARTVFPSQGFDRWYWNDEVLDKAGLDREKFPPFVSPGETIGTLLPAVARRFGFSVAAGGAGHSGAAAGGGIPVIAGGPDFFASILGVGAVHPGEACDRSGTSEGINVCTAGRIVDARLMSYGYPVKPYWNLSGIISTTGKAIVWVRELLGIDGEPFENFFELAGSAAGGGTPVFLPYLAGERAPIWDPKARGVFFGLSLSSGRAELARSVAEGICFAIRDVVTVMEECGAELRELRVSGHPGESDFLNQLKADITGKDVLAPVQKDAELAGLAALGAVALGTYSSAGEAASAMVKIRRVYHGDEKKAALYEGLFAQYRETYRALKQGFA
ncbi:xylulokinase [Spirochaetia bacterium]|nr:xylulokinase [Spirochaetia bacterium]